MSNNVIILGAGFSHGAGIPLLGNFVEQMIDIAARETLRDKPVPPDDLRLIQDAMKIRGELDGYHGRAVFNDRNIEDILSILAFNSLSGGPTEKRKFQTVADSIAKTIDLCCALEDPRGTGGQIHIQDNKEGAVYRAFWAALLKWAKVSNEMPAIITFNYDLVLELSLLQVLNSTMYNATTKPRPFTALQLRYGHFPELDVCLQVQPVDYQTRNYGSSAMLTGGTRTQLVGPSTATPAQEIKILKLHGALNFPKQKNDARPQDFARPVERPLILPPISNKLSEKSAQSIWKHAIKELREARNVVFVGYSLPRTDIYMQYFLKAAFGPNRNLSKISVFDPVLHSGGSAGREMEDRFLSCFATQMHPHIEFRPVHNSAVIDGGRSGTAEHFVNALTSCPNEMFF
ncbi:hypothetical protein [Woeseia oceani]|uniref:SIR2-like domain-containing protein n=1 Tax=Woeseia oceani TaxID=1548547 RepID=A0A193LEG1_9GAMM|nr:hypothetical protein [Woeseia oceani]ANO50841.1 hypothetical protein BA177_06140 [Woeseia oceani]